jgi:F-type H+-transporting ATPase subunit gamma
MANLKEIRRRIKSVQSTQQVTSAMKMVAAAKLRKAQDNIIRLRPYAAKIREIMAHVAGAADASQVSKLAEGREVSNVLVVMVTSNRGLCGAFNSNIIRHGAKFISENFAAERDNGKLQVLCIGKKGFDYFKKRNYKILQDKNFDVFHDLSFDRVNEITNLVFEGYKDQSWDKVFLVYNEFKNVIVQTRMVESFLPLAVEKQLEDEKKPAVIDYIFEPNKKEILTDLIPQALRIQMYRAILESNAGEQGARMAAMDNATSNAEEMLRELKLSYNKARQAAITKELLEIVSGANALSAG